MKKSILLTILGFALVHFNFTNKLIIKLGTGILITNKVISQNIIPYLDATNHTYNWIISNSPGNTPQTAIVLTRMAYDSIFFRQKYIKFDTLNLIPSTTIDGKLLWIRSNGIVAVTSFSSLTFPYSQLTGTPSIPSAQINTDWNSGSGLSQILNKPTLFTGSFTDLTSKPTTLSGYGITDAETKTAISSSLSTKFNTPSGTTSQYIRGDGSLLAFPTIPTQVNITGAGITNISGSYPNITITSTEVDASTSNELQNLSVTGSSINISNGNSVLVPNLNTYYNLSSTVTAINKELNAIITPTASSSYTINISSAGFSTISSISLIAAKSSTLATSCPNVSISSYNTSQIVVNVTEGNPTTVNILGSLVLLGAANVFANTSGLTLHLCVKGN